MPGSVILHPCVDILICISHQACPVTPRIAAWSVDIYIAYGVTSGFMHFVKLNLILVMTNFFAKRLDWEVL